MMYVLVIEDVSSLISLSVDPSVDRAVVLLFVVDVEGRMPCSFFFSRHCCVYCPREWNAVGCCCLPKVCCYFVFVVRATSRISAAAVFETVFVRVKDRRTVEATRNRRRRHPPPKLVPGSRSTDSIARTKRLAVGVPCILVDAETDTIVSPVSPQFQVGFLFWKFK